MEGKQGPGSRNLVHLPLTDGGSKIVPSPIGVFQHPSRTPPTPETSKCLASFMLVGDFDHPTLSPALQSCSVSLLPDKPRQFSTDLANRLAPVITISSSRTALG